MGTLKEWSRAVAQNNAARVLALCLGLGLAVWGQHGIHSPVRPGGSLFLFVVGVTLAVLAAVPMLGTVLAKPDPQVKVEPPEPSPPTRPGSRRERAIVAASVAAALGLAVAAFQLSGNNRFTFLGVVLWGASVLLFIGAFWERPEGAPDEVHPKPSRLAGWLPRWTGAPALAALTLLGAVALAAFFRFYRLDTVPFDMTSDHVEKLLDIRRVVGGQFDVFFANNGGREPMEFYLAAGLIKVFGLDLEFLTLKVTMALAGLLLLPVTYLLILELWGSRTLAVLSACFLAVSHWAISISRVGLRFTFAPLLAALTLLFLIRGLRSLRTNDFLLAGLFLGLGMYGYQAFRVMPLAVGVCVALRLGAACWRRQRAEAMRLLGNSGLMAVLALLVYAPMAKFWQQFPDDYWNRFLTRATETEAEAGNRLLTFLGNLKGLALMFNWKGDVIWLYNVPDSPALDYVMGALFVVGFLLVILWGLARRDLTSAYVVATFVILLLPSALALTFPRENPSISRGGAALPLAFGFVAVPAYLLMERLRDLPWKRLAAAAAGLGLAGLLAAAAFANYQWYFTDYAEQYQRSVPNHRDIAATMQAFADQGGSIDRAYIRSWPYWLDHRAVALNLGDPDWNNNLLEAEQVREVASEGGPRLFVLHPDDSETLGWLTSHFPEGTAELHEFPYGHPFVTFVLPEEIAPVAAPEPDASFPAGGG